MQKRNTKIPMTVGPKFKVIRKKNHVSLKSLAQKVGITSTSALSRWERGETGLPVEKLKNLSFQLLEKYHHELEKYHHENDEYLKKEALIKSAIALNFYFDLSGQDLSDDEYKKTLAEQFVGIKHWFKKEIILFANIQ